MSWTVIVIAVVVCVFVMIVVKRLISLVISLAVIGVLFYAGFIWGPNDLNEKLHLNAFLTPEAQQQVQSAYADYTKHRDAHQIVKSDAVDAAIQQLWGKAKNEAGSAWGKVDKKKLIEEWAEIMLKDGKDPKFVDEVRKSAEKQLQQEK